MRAPEAGDEVHADDVERVVVAEAVLQADGQGREATGDDAEDDRAERADSAPQAGVMATRPATTPEARSDRGGVPVTDLLHDQPAEHGRAGGGVVLIQTRAEVPSAASSEPALNPNQPNHSRPAPSMASGTLCGRIEILPKPSRLPTIEREHQAGHTGVDVHHGATGEVDRDDVGGAVGGSEDQGRQARLVGGEQAAAPDHVGDREVREGHPQAG